MGPRASVFCHNGLGDGVNSLVLSNNLQLNGWKVDTYQKTLPAMQSWFPHLSVLPYPPLSELAKILSSYDWFFVVHNDTDPFVQKLIQEGKRRFPDRIKVIYLYPSKNIVNEPYYSDCLTEPHLPIAENLRFFCERVLRLSKITRSNGFIPPAQLTHRKHTQRIVLHPTGTRITKNWPREKFVKLALHLQERGCQVACLIHAAEGRDEWQNLLGTTISIPHLPDLDAVARFIYESGFFIGNDSGPGHLASALGIPTITICRRKTFANMWAPSFTKGIIVTPYRWIPNISGFRLRDRCWKNFISVRMVLRAFERLQT